MNPGDRVFLIDSQGRHEGEITKLSHREGLVIVKWDTGMTERVPVEELTTVKNEVRPASLETLLELQGNADTQEEHDALELQIIAARKEVD